MTSLSEKVKGLSRRRKVGRFCALDFDGRQLRIVEAESSGGRTRIRKAVAADMPEGLDLADAAALGALVAKTLSQMRPATTSPGRLNWRTSSDSRRRRN